MKKKPTESESTTRLDIWLWATRLFKTRALAVDACKNSQVTVNGQNAKPGRQIQVGDRVSFRRGPLTRTVEAKAPIKKRISAKLVDDYLIDHTPPEEYEKAATVRKMNRDTTPTRKSGLGRPTKKERRELDGISGDFVSDADTDGFKAFAKAMKKNINLILLALFLTGSVVSANAQQAPPARSFKPDPKAVLFPISPTLTVHALKVAPEKDAAGTMTAMAATGKVLIKFRPKGQEKDILIACDKAVYDAGANTIKLTGWPFVKSGPQLLKASKPETFVKIDRGAGKWSIEGPHKITFSLGG